jgi:hypothetical protein
MTPPFALRKHPKTLFWAGRWIPTWVLSALMGACTVKLKPVERVVEVPQIKRAFISLEGMEPTDLERKDIIFEISGCIEPTLGKLVKEDKKLTIVHPSLNSTMVCTLNVKKLEPDPTLKFMIDEKPYIMYQSTQVILSNDFNGQLQGIAFLQKFYHLATDTPSKD